MTAQTEMRFSGAVARVTTMHRTATITAPFCLTPAEHGQAGASDALDGVGGGLPDATKVDIRQGIASFRGRPFTTDTLRGRLSQATRDILAHPHHHNALQGMVTTMAKAGAIRFTGERVRSSRPEARGREIKVWEER